MLDIDRQDKILKILTERKSITTNELQKLVFASSSTIIRDLIKMEKQGLIKRTHGGASIIIPKDTESSLTLRVKKNINEKNKIARKVIELIDDNSSIFIDSSTTVQALIPYLSSFKFLTIITNGLNNALLLSAQTSASIYFIGGMVATNSNSAIGSMAIDTLQKLNADYTIISAGGVQNNSITEYSVEQANVKRMMIKKSKKTFLLVDSSKFNKINIAQIARIEEIDYLISEQEPPQDIMEIINKSKCEFIKAND